MINEFNNIDNDSQLVSNSILEEEYKINIKIF